MRGDRERATYLGGVERAAAESDAMPFAYCTMSSHIHWGVLGRDAPLGKFLHPLHTAFGRWWNERHGGLGRVFAERPSSSVVQDEQELARLVAYIHNNPVRAGVVDDPLDSDWTSHRAYVGLAASPPWLNVKWALAAMGFSAAPSGRAAFHDFVVSRADLPRDPLLGGPGPVPADTINTILVTVADYSGLAPAELRTITGGSDAVRAREILVQVATEAFGVSGRQLAHSLGISPSAVSRTKHNTRAPVDRAVLHELVERCLRRSASTADAQAG